MPSFSKARLVERLAPLDAQRNTLFAWLCADRARACCRTFGLVYDVNVSVFLELSARIYSAISEGRVESTNDMAEQLEALAAAIPISEEYGSPLAVQAQNGMAALLCAASVSRSEDDASNYVYSAGIDIIGETYSFTDDDVLHGREISCNSFGFGSQRLASVGAAAVARESFLCCATSNLAE